MKSIIVIPAYNESAIIQGTVQRLFEALRNQHITDTDIVIVDNNSSDETGVTLEGLCFAFPNLKSITEPRQGKGYAVLETWKQYQNKYDAFIFMDADLSTSLEAISALLQGIDEGYDIVSGSRYLPDSVTDRVGSRAIASKLYRACARLILDADITDFPCGFKAVSQKTVRELIPFVTDRGWFFDTELLYKAKQKGFKIKEIPVAWKEERSAKNPSKLNLYTVVPQYMRGLLRLKRERNK